MILKANNIHKAYAGTDILKGCSLSLEKGKIYAIAGENGSGKSTLLKILGGLLRFDAGEILLNQRSIKEYSMKERARLMATVSQLEETATELSVETVVALGRFPYRGLLNSARAGDSEIVREALEKTGTSHLKKRSFMTLSGGERQRVRIAMALAQEPRLLLLDEPTTFLDIRYQLEILDLLRVLNQRDQLTVLMVLHDLNHCIEYADELILLKDGKIKGMGTPHDLVVPETIQEVFGVESTTIAMDDKKYLTFRRLK